ncbi:MarR family winged helix-turn-helix transcriptional regulator [Lewinella sp. IMCC34191]|uniref:MarR family winged helix-turn-helix transcriptional regulator n=1 Tax=Lewinella sp. IMCC34191 TaxID=2259172 RepID=UPI000E2850A7|nr:MarR family transcriptional regulator [Lewinella sp. IMCC34191]
MNEDASALLLDNQLCFPLYAASRLVTKLYAPLLADLDLTYPQYLVLLLLWERDGRTVTEIGDRLYLETNTLTPLLKRLQRKGMLRRERSAEDERKVIVRLTAAGRDLRERAHCIPASIVEAVGGEAADTEQLEAFRRTLGLLIDRLGRGPA